MLLLARISKKANFSHFQGCFSHIAKFQALLCLGEPVFLQGCLTRFGVLRCGKAGGGHGRSHHLWGLTERPACRPPRRQPPPPGTGRAAGAPSQRRSLSAPFRAVSQDGGRTPGPGSHGCRNPGAFYREESPKLAEAGELPWKRVELTVVL